MDLAAAAERYISAIGLNSGELSALKSNLSLSYNAATAQEPEAEEELEETVELNQNVPGYMDAPADPVAVLPAPAVSGSTYTVVSGDCLWGIAKKLYNDGTRWTEIYERNKAAIKNPNRISIGQVLNIPAV